MPDPDVEMLPTWHLIEMARDGIDSFAGDASLPRRAFDVLASRLEEYAECRKNYADEVARLNRNHARLRGAAEGAQLALDWCRGYFAEFEAQMPQHLSESAEALRTALEGSGDARS